MRHKKKVVSMNDLFLSICDCNYNFFVFASICFTVTLNICFVLVVNNILKNNNK